MALNSTHKGKRGENEFCEWLDKNLGIDYAEREYNQAKGGADVIVADFIFEVKRRETLGLGNWWYQVAVAKNRHPDRNLIPVVAFRQNRKAWRFLIPANLLTGVKVGYLECNAEVFVQFAKTIIRN